MFEKLSDAARKSFQSAEDEARRLNHERLGPEHLLLGLVSVPHTDAAAILQRLDVDPERVRSKVESLRPPGSAPVKSERIPQNESAKRNLEHAITVARLCRHRFVGTGHLLLANLLSSDGVAQDALGVGSEDVRQELMELDESGDLKEGA